MPPSAAVFAIQGAAFSFVENRIDASAVEHAAELALAHPGIGAVAGVDANECRLEPQRRCRMAQIMREEVKRGPEFASPSTA